MSETLIGALIGLGGVILGVILSYFTSLIVSKYTAKQTITYELLQHFNSPDFLYVLQIFSKIRNEWKTKEGKMIVSFFIPTDNLEKPKEQILDNKLTTHQNLTLYLRFLSQVYYYYESKFANRKMIKELFVYPHFVYVKSFLNEFKDEFLKLKEENNITTPDPKWLIAIQKFNVLTK
nr:hypothetical protein [uncultured Draconibacterium sp.]